MAVYQYQQILSMYTQMIPFSRYDVLLYELGRLMLTDIKPDTHVLNQNYRSYNTYRKDIGPDTSSLKINETYNNQDNIEDTYYEIKSLDTSYVFDGIVLSKKFATNGNEMSLEDLFAEFYYDYLCAVDSSYLYSPDYGETYYFNQSYVDPVTQEEVIGGTYEILPIGTTYMNEDHEATNVEYDGTYVPTIGEILSGTLYIVIQSQGKPPRKIMFNNIQLPTLFINDDKYYTTDEYIMNDNQLMRLCDVKLYSKLGCRIGWEKIAYFDGENLKNMLLGITNYEYLLDDAGKITEGSVFFRIYYRAIYKNSAAIDETLFISGPVRVDYYWNGSSFVDQNLEYSSGFVDRPEHGWIWSEPVNTNNYQFDTEYFLTNRDRDFCNATTGYIPASTVESHTITVHIWFGMSLIFKGFTLNEPSPNTYTLHWYKYTADPTTFTGSIQVKNNLSQTINSIVMNFNPTLHLTVGTGLTAGGTQTSNYSIPDSSKNTSFSLQNLTVNAASGVLTENTDYTYTFNKNPWVPVNAKTSGILTINTVSGSKTLKYFIWNNFTGSGNSRIIIKSINVKFNNNTIEISSGGSYMHYHTYYSRDTKVLPAGTDSLTWSTLTITFVLESDTSGSDIVETVTNGQTGDTNKTYIQTNFIAASDWQAENPSIVTPPSVWTQEFLDENLFRISVIAKPFHLT